jgi:hypothetical protein
METPVTAEEKNAVKVLFVREKLVAHMASARHDEWLGIRMA